VNRQRPKKLSFRHTGVINEACCVVGGCEVA
jgi:hypothetical protein